MDFGPDVSTYARMRVGLFGDSFLPLHNGHIAMINEAAREVDVLFVAVLVNESYERACCEGTGFTPLGSRLRERWLSEIFADQPNVRVLAAPATLPLPDPQTSSSANASGIWNELAVNFRALEGRCDHLDAVFCEDAAYPAVRAALEVVTRERAAWPAVSCVGLTAQNLDSARIRREGVLAHWDDLPEPVQRHYTKRVAFCGWESSGKSYTAEHIAKALGTECVPEYGREYYERLNSYEDIGESQDALNTMAGQLHSLERARGNKVLCIDTDLIYTQFYHLKDFGWMHPALDALIKARAEKIDEWIFLEPRNPLADDGSRFRYDDAERQATSNSLQDLYRHYGCGLHVVDEADDAKRLEVCTELVRSFL